MSVAERLRLLKDVASDESVPESQRRIAEDALREWADIFKANPLQRFEPYAKQEMFLSASERTKAFFGGNRAGKTEIGIVDDLIQAVDRDCLPPHLARHKRFDPPFYCRIVTGGFGVNEGVVLEKLRGLCPKDQMIGGSWERAYKKEAIPILRFKNGSWIQFLTSEQDVDKHAGAKLHRVHFDEEPPGDHGFQIYRENRMRLIDFGGQAMFTMTPLLGLSWTYDVIWENREEPNIFCVVASMLDNHHLPREIVQQELDLMGTNEERLARVEGNFVHFQGKVLDLFDIDRHVIDPVEPDHVKGQDVIVGIDPGVTRGGVVWCAFDRDNHMLVFDELYPKDMDVPQIADAIKLKNKEWELDEDAILYVIDPTARNRVHTTAENVQGAFAQEEIYCKPGQNDRETGILQLKARTRQGRLLVTRNCQSWLNEQKRYVIASDEQTGKGAVSGFKTRGADHLMDPTRYAAMERLYDRDDDPKPMRLIRPLDQSYPPPKQGGLHPLGAMT